MKREEYKYVLIISLTLLCGLIVHRVETAEPVVNSKFFSFPLMIGEWEGKEIAVHEYVYEIIDTPYFILRDYHSPRHHLPVNLSIVWCDDRNLAFHAPEACLGGIGSQVEETSQRHLAIQGSECILDAFTVRIPGHGEQLVWYFFVVDGLITTSQTIIRLQVLKKRLSGKRTSAAFIRLMAPVAFERTESERVLAAFLESLLPLVPEYTCAERTGI